MYGLPPPIESLEWSFGLVFDVCVKLGLGKDDVGNSPWTLVELSKEFDPNEGSYVKVKNWGHGNTITKTDLDKLIICLTTGEEYEKQWAHVLKKSANNIQPAVEIKKQRNDYFEIESFPDKRKEAFDIVSTRISKSKPFLSGKKKSKGSTVGLKSVLVFAGLITASVLFLYNDVLYLDFKEREAERLLDKFSNIQFCAEEDFSEKLNQCLKNQNVFKYGIEEVNISFESDVLVEDDTFYLYWYRQREFFLKSKKRWDRVFSKDFKYASTFIKTIGGLEAGEYQIRFYNEGNIFRRGEVIGEAFFEIVD
ncbi:MAG: hypothetical protein ACRBEE_12465 [Arenicella sp.]